MTISKGYQFLLSCAVWTVMALVAMWYFNLPPSVSELRTRSEHLERQIRFTQDALNEPGFIPREDRLGQLEYIATMRQEQAEIETNILNRMAKRIASN